MGGSSKLPFGVLLALLGAAAALFFVLDVALGSVLLPLKEVWQVLFGNASLAPETSQIIVQQVRLPRACTALLTGAALSVGGLMMQTLFRNPLAGPSILGISAGASLGVAFVLLTAGTGASAMAIRGLGLDGSWALIGAATLGAAAVMVVVLGISLAVRDPIIVLIIGMMISNITMALVSLWQYFSAPEAIQDYLLWSFGSLGAVARGQLFPLLMVVLVGLALSALYARPLNALLLGETYARSLGLNIRQLRIGLVATTSLLAGGVTAFVGPIAFVGIAVPHLARGLVSTADHRRLMPLCALLGAVMLLGCDILAQLPGHAITLPINVVTSLVGSPVVVWVILRRRKQQTAFS